MWIALTLEWFKLRLGLGEGELEFVEVGVLDNASMLISSFGGEDASICAPRKRIQEYKTEKH